MRDFKGMKRQRGRNRKPSGANNANNANPNRSWDSQGPENIKVRGNAQTVYERYQQLGRDATASGDRVLAENYMQHAEHYFRVLRALQPQRPVSEIAARELSNQGFDIDFEDETGAQAAAFLAAQQAADRAAQQGENRNNDRSNDRGNDRVNDRDGENGSRDQNRNENRGEGQQREWRDRDNRDRDNRDRDNQNRSERSGEDRETRAEGEEGQGGRRETRRERWERRREERNRRFEAEGGVGEAPDNAAYSGSDQGDAAPASEPAVEAVEERAVEAPVAVKTERPRRTRMPRENDAEDAPSALPGFLTRSAAPAAAVAETVDVAADAEAPAPKRRAPRRKVEAATED